MLVLRVKRREAAFLVLSLDQANLNCPTFMGMLGRDGARTRDRALPITAFCLQAAKADSHTNQSFNSQ